MEVNYNSQGWGTVCDDSWITTDGDVACRMLGYKSASSVTTRAQYGEGSGIIWFDDVYCEGSESSLLDCSHSGFQVHNCRHSEDAGVVCSSKSSTLHYIIIQKRICTVYCMYWYFYLKCLWYIAISIGSTHMDPVIET